MSESSSPASFAPSNQEDWKSAAEALLKGAPFDKVMMTPTPEGITLQPIYPREALDALPQAAALPGADGYLRGHRADGFRVNPWEISQELPLGEPAAFNRALLQDLARGQTAVNVLLDIATVNGHDPDSAPAGEVCACGLSLACLADLRRALREVVPGAVSFHFHSACGGLAVEALFLAWLAETGTDPAGVRGALNMDPLGTLAMAGTLPTSLDQAYDELALLAAHNAVAMPGFAAAGASGMPVHAAGGSAVEELGAVLATGLAYLRALTARGVALDDAAGQIRFTLALGGNFFMELAKLRAARVLWARIVTELGGSPEAAKMRVHARTGIYNKTRHDPYVNMLRTTTEALSGVLGGADSLCVGAFDECLRLPDEFSRRIARNTQVILQEECELTAVIDPAGGSWFIESLTDGLARAGWDFFRRIEGQGGIAAVLESGWLETLVAATRGGREKLLGQRRVSLVGTNQYPNLGEKPLPPGSHDFAVLREKRARELASYRLAGELDNDQLILERLAALAPGGDVSPLPAVVEAMAAGATIGEVTRAVRSRAAAAPRVKPLPASRLALPYERLREAAAGYARAHGHPPRIHLATLGVLRRHKPRADFIRGFFETGGFEVLADAGCAEPGEVAARALAAAAPLVVICGHDEDYPELVPAVARLLKAASPAPQVLLAGHPGEHEAAFREAGLDDFVFVKSDNLQTNRRYLQQVGALPAGA
jgi:methylmalonyl-CoA mutase